MVQGWKGFIQGSFAGKGIAKGNTLQLATVFERPRFDPPLPESTYLEQHDIEHQEGP